MRTWTGAAPVAIGAVTLAVTLTGCNFLEPAKGKNGSGAPASKTDKTYRLGEPSPPQESTMQKSSDATFTVTPTKVQTGTKADLDRSGLDQKKEDGPRVPVYVWATLTHKSGTAMELGDMDDDLVVKTNTGGRSRALIVLMGQAKWPNCPSFDTTKMLSAGQSEQTCRVFLIPEGQQVAAVQLSQGFNSEPLEWTVTN